MIPHKLHLIWMGERPAPQRWIDGWVEAYSHWNVRLWSEKDIRSLPLRNQAVFDWYASRGRWNGAADVARVEILHAEGGVYVDVDALPLQPLDDAPFMQAGFFAGLVRRRDRLSNGCIGAEVGHPVLQTYMQLMSNVKQFLPPSQKVGSVLLTQAVGVHGGRPDITILPPRTFNPVRKNGKPEPGDDPAYIQQLWAGSNRRYEA